MVKEVFKRFPASLYGLNILIFLIAIHFSLSVVAQGKRSPGHLLNTRDALEILYNKYITSKGDPESKIKELRELMDADARKGDLSNALRKIQISLILEKQVAEPSATTFELNVYIGEFISGINKGYALGFFEKATAIAKTAKAIHPYRLFHMFTNRAGSHQYLMEYDSARFYYYKAIQTAMVDDKVSVASSYNNLGYFYNAIQQYDSARIYFQKALTLLGNMETQLTLYMAIIDNIAQLDVKDGKYQEAIRVFKFNDSTYLSINWPANYIINKVRLMETMVKANDPHVHQQISELQDYIEQHGSGVDEKYILDFYEFANDYYFNNAMREDQLFFREGMKRLKEKIEKRNIEQLDLLGQVLLDIQELSWRSDIEAYQLREEKQKLELRNTRFTAIAGIVSLFLILLLLLVYMRQRRHEHETEKRMAEVDLRRKEMEAMLVEQQLELKKHDLTNVVLHNTQVYDANQKIIERLQEIFRHKTNVEEELRTFLIDLQQQNQISDRSIGLQSNIDSVNAEFYEKLKTRYPDLTKAETELCGYIRINLSTKDISILKNVEADSVKKGKTRLRKKFGLSPEDDLYQFIREI